MPPVSVLVVLQITIVRISPPFLTRSLIHTRKSAGSQFSSGFIVTHFSTQWLRWRQPEHEPFVRQDCQGYLYVKLSSFPFYPR